MKSSKAVKQLLLIVTLIATIFANPLQAQNPVSIYTNNMQYVLGDAKQAFIKNMITTTAKAENLIVGFKNMKVNGIRMPIFADGLCPNKEMFDYFFQRATAEGFPIFASPAQSSGGQRIANGVLNYEGTLGSVKNDPVKTNVLINVVKAFANEYPCKWINPFNEDGEEGGAWSASQMNTIFSSLYNQVNGAELIGPCVWGIPASISVLRNTNIRNYITVASTHNLGFDHKSWPAFISLANEKSLPAWDSEVNNFDAQGNGTRLEAALAAKVDGLVMYNSWNDVNLTNGVVNSSGQTQMSLYLKSPAGIDQISRSSFITIFPNPASDYIQIYSSEKPIQLELLDLNAIVLKTIPTENAQIDVSFLKSGMYFVRCKTQENTLIKRFIKR
ncbi:MAG: T9SS type A sorting domain-containing protein [Bacteroidia bacterium]|nr:T9SS type A sorting domain-containing protein [Bacteroidia bacterium]